MFEEAEYGYRKAVEFGATELETWLYWVNVLQYLGEFDAAIQTLLQACDIFPDEYEIEYRLAGLHLTLNETEKGLYHLNNGLRQSFKNRFLVEEIFPGVWDTNLVQETIAKYKK